MTYVDRELSNQQKAALYDAMVKMHSEWVWERCPGCGRASKYHPTLPQSHHSDACPLEGLYGHTHQWWYEKELASKRDISNEVIGKVLEAALERWCIDQELGSWESLVIWVRNFLSEDKTKELLDAN